MAKSITHHVEDMTDAAIPAGTAMYFQVRDPMGAVEEYAADNSKPFAAVVDDQDIKLGEKLFVQSRFMVTSSEGGGLLSKPATWMQLNATNFPTADIAALKTALKDLYDTQRLFEDLVPA